MIKSLSSIDESNTKVYLSFGKRIFDLALAILALIAVSPLLVIVALLVRIRLGKPVLFKQMRPGLHEKPFTLFKFRTMTDERDIAGELLPDDKRLTMLGSLLRKSSIDELPELFNVLKGEMSIVGPRPLFMHYLTYYTERESLRHTVRPGITGLAQVNGRNYLPWDERLEMDVQYVEKMSFSLDIKIIFQTFFQVLKAKNVAVLPTLIGVPLSEYRKQKK
ncbi:lipid carrier : udp-n-acetylgalactosaminyltransferase [hydrocarbon metagenome]|uniref:Lipid carrier: udp-n-acetylgalactosaminyltransferase n=1 Tax=hydrocarbon metagenome TaxID=938273 RepID=A0A0W8FSW8_9ZZZZ